MTVGGRALAVAALVAGAGLAAQQEPAGRIPLAPGLTVVTAVTMSGVCDCESVKQITGITDQEVTLSYAADVPERGIESLFGGKKTGKIQQIRGRRSIRRADLTSAREYAHLFGAGMPQRIPGSTALGVSAAVLRDLKNKGESPLTMRSSGLGSALGSLIGAFGGAEFSGVKEIRDLDDIDKITGTLKRVETTPVSLRVLVNDRIVELPAIHARGRLGDLNGDFYFLDDEGNPLALKWQLGDDKLQVIKIAYVEKAAGAAKPSRLETQLAEQGRVDVYGIYFDFGSDAIRPESEPVLKEIGGVMKGHPAWTLAIEGHTDNVGTNPYNLDLSKRRAAAVRQALVDRHGVTGGRLTTAGFGASRPKDTTDTLEGRALNRRVELVRR